MDKRALGIKKGDFLEICRRVHRICIEFVAQRVALGSWKGFGFQVPEAKLKPILLGDLFSQQGCGHLLFNFLE